MPQTSYSRHAWSRVLSRLSLTPAEVAALLDYDLAVSVGVRGRKVHRLFFSPPDRQCFVAVQDQDMGVVVTVLPLDYHASCAWEVSRDTQDHAERLTRSRPTSSSERAAWQDGGAPSVFRVGCYVTSGGVVSGIRILDRCLRISSSTTWLYCSRMMSRWTTFDGESMRGVGSVRLR